MQITNMHEAKTNLTRLMDRAARGETIIIGKAGKPMAVLTRYCGPVHPRRPGGSWKGKVWMADDFDELPEDIAEAFGVES